MTRVAVFALFFLSLITLMAWAVSQFVIPHLPADVGDSLLLLFFALASSATVLASYKDIIELLRFWEENRNRAILREAFARGPYDWATIERSTRYYIYPKCSNIDPSQETEPRHALMATRERLFAKVDYFLEHDHSHRHLLILADSGTGKTSFLLNYYAYNARRSGRKRHQIALVPLGMKDSDERIAGILMSCLNRNGRKCQIIN